MRIVVTDVSVFFDLYHIRVLPEFFALDFEICTTDFVAKEILQDSQKDEFEIYIRSKQLTVIKLSPDEIETVIAFQTKRRFISLPDKTILWKALQMKSILLTADKKLRSEAEDLKIEVHGCIWVIKMLTETNIITSAKGIEFLKQLKSVNDSLPKDEIDKLIKKLKPNVFNK